MEDINYFVNFLIKETLDILIGIKFFLLNPSEFLSSKIISSLLIPFFSIKVLFENEIELLNL